MLLVTEQSVFKLQRAEEIDCCCASVVRENGGSVRTGGVRQWKDHKVPCKCLLIFVPLFIIFLNP